MSISDKLSKSQQAYFNAAKSISKLSDHKCQIGCVVVDKHRIISSGYNSRYKGCMLQAELDRTILKIDDCNSHVHAEVSALKNLQNRDLTSAVMYIYREHHDGTPAISKPCSRCMSLIKQNHIRYIFYTVEHGYMFEEIIY